MSGDQEYDSLARVTLERIRLRLRGGQAYIAAMRAWVREPIPENATTLDASSRVIEGARALSLLGVKEAVPDIMERYFRKDGLRGSWSLARSLARMNDPRTLSALEDQARRPPPPPDVWFWPPREPGEPDILITYWNLRLAGKTRQERIDALARASQEEPFSPLRPQRMLKLEGAAGSESRKSLRMETKCKHGRGLGV